MIAKRKREQQEESYKSPFRKSTREIIEAIKQITGAKTDDEVAEKLEYPYPSKTSGNGLANARWRDAIPFYEHLITFCDKNKISLESLIYTKYPKPLKQIYVPTMVDENDYNWRTVSVLSAVGAGSPMEILEAEPIEFIYVPKRIYGSSMKFFRVRGDSMNPIIRDKAIIAVDTEQISPIDGYIFCCFWPGEGVIVRRIHVELDHYILEPENKENHKSKIVPFDRAPENFIIGKVEYLILQEMPGAGK